MNRKWSWGEFWAIFTIVCIVLFLIGTVASIMEWNFLAVLGVAVAAFCGISALSLMIMWFIPKFEEWASEEGWKRAMKTRRK